MRKVHGYMTDEEWHKLKEATILMRGARLAPQHYTREEVERAVRTDIELSGSICERLEISEVEDVDYDLSTGAVVSLD